ncbi:hypothetical protein [Streptomyces sp.]|uniref:hypothetical protein n=1 Tax=Streptomyces sp. TaxID=1931 RepID=UPI002F94E224
MTATNVYRRQRDLARQARLAVAQRRIDLAFAAAGFEQHADEALAVVEPGEGER